MLGRVEQGFLGRRSEVALELPLLQLKVNALAVPAGSERFQQHKTSRIESGLEPVPTANIAIKQ